MTNVFNTNLSLLRNRKGISIHKLSMEIPIHKNTLRNIEYGNSEVKASQLLILCDYFGIDDVRDFLTRKLN